MNKIGVYAGVGAIALASAGLITSSEWAAAAGPTTLHVQELARHVTYVPVGQLTGSKKQSNQGDYIVFHDPLVTPGTAKRVGWVNGLCLLAAPKDGRFFCSVNFAITGKGQIAATGMFDSSGSTTTASVTGGVGAYRSATGTVTLKPLSQTKNDFVIHLDG
jgi:hypothetical protein